MEIIGEGAFGRVHKAEYVNSSNNKIVVAVKMLKGNSTSNERYYSAKVSNRIQTYCSQFRGNFLKYWIVMAKKGSQNVQQTQNVRHCATATQQCLQMTKNICIRDV